MERTIDINCDLGESYGNFKVGNDEAIFPHISSCNIACGFHGGDPRHIEETIDRAIAHEVQIGAHPSYQDLAGFGRRSMAVKPEDLKSIVKYQIAALKGLVESKGAKLNYVKPHGALYNDAAWDTDIGVAICAAISELDDSLALMGLANSAIGRLAVEGGLKFIAEAFADRRYAADGTLVARSRENAIIHSPEDASNQVLRMITEGVVESQEGQDIAIEASSICIHGDHPNSVEIATHLRAALEANAISVKAFSV